MSKIFDVTKLNYANPTEFKKEFQGKNVHCQNHEDRNPSAQVNETNVYCYVCAEAFFYIDSNNQYDLNAGRAKKYQNSLNSAKNNSPIRQFLKTRDIKDSSISDFELGFDETKNALVFPIKNRDGKVNSFGYREIQDGKHPKYWNDPGLEKDSASVFLKRNNLYGIHTLTNECRHLIICEGYIDVIQAYQHGFKSQICFVGLMGTALTNYHIPLLKHVRKTKNIKMISLMLDRDEPGQQATLKNIEVLLKNGIYPKIIADFREDNEFIKCKDIDEILKSNGKNYLNDLIKHHTYDWLDYLLKINDTLLNSSENRITILKELKRYINLIEDPNFKGDYASRLCSLENLYEDVRPKDKIYDNILSLKSENVKKHFLEEESYFNCKLPYYFEFTEVLRWAQKHEKQFNCKDFRNLKDANYKILGNKNGEFAWRKYQIINPILYVKLVNVIRDNWEELQSFFHKNTFENIECVSLPVIEKKSDKFSNNTARQIINWWEDVEQKSIKLALRYRNVIHTDIVDCYGSIYTHSIPQVLNGIEIAKKNRNDEDCGNKIDWLLQGMNWGQTNGIPQGSVLMDFIAEIVLHGIDCQLVYKCNQHKKIKEYHILRYRDDYRIFSNEIETAREVLKLLSEVLSENGGMRLSSEKTRVETCVISGSLKKDKLHYFECFKRGNSLRQNALNIYLFAKKHPNSGSLFRLLQELHAKIKKEINQISSKILDGKKEGVLEGFDPEYLVSVLSEIMYQHPRTYAVACAMIFDIIAILPNEKRKTIWKNIGDKMASVPNNELLRIWLERAVYIQPKDKKGWHDFFENCSTEENKTLLLKAFKGEEIWQFPQNHFDDLDTSLILADSIKDKLEKAETHQEQEMHVNVPFSLDEINPFAYFS